MNRRSFMKWLGFGAATVAVPAIAAPEKSGPTISEARGPVVGYRVWLGGDGILHRDPVYADEFYAAPSPPVLCDLRWSEDDLAKFRSGGLGPLVINRITK